MKNNLFSALAVLATVFFIYGTAQAEQAIPAKINIENLTSGKANTAIQKCGVDLLMQLRGFAVCEKQGYGCQGSSQNQNEYSSKALSDNETQLDHYFGAYNRYDDYHAYDGKSYSLSYIAITKNTANKNNPLFFKFTENARDENKGQEYHATTELITVGDMPVFRFNKKEIKHCNYDEWGKQDCKKSTFEYSNPKWVLSDKFIPVVNWMNFETKVVLNKTANFGQYMSCVEQNIR